MKTIEPFETFIARTTSAIPDQYAVALQAVASRAGISSDDAHVEFERMKAYILKYYEGVQPHCSYLDESSNVIDCVPFEQQPAYRAALKSGHGDITPPPHAQKSTVKPVFSVGEQAQSPERAATGSGRCTVCPPNTVPLPRVTLEQLIPFGTLDNYFRKEPAAQ
jgi:hypothetical protein